MSKDQTASKGGSAKKPGLKVASGPKKGPARKQPRRSSTAARARDTALAVFGPLRAELEFTRAQFSRLIGFSERAVAEWESGARAPSEPAVRSHRELERMIKGLRRVMKPAYVSTWLMTPNRAFDSLKPVEVIERGESDRIWRMLYDLKSGNPL
jgi:transcriptional regulator with XRE-family HTH domain